MKRILSVLVCAALSGSILAGCSSGQTDAPTGTDDGGLTTTVPAYTLTKEGSNTDGPPVIKATQKWKVGVTLPHLANPHFIAMAYGFVSEAEKLGVEAIVNEAGGYTKLPVQIQQFEDFMAMPADAIILIAVDGEGTTALVDAANEKNIPVINVNVMTANDNVVTRIRSDDYTIGQMDGEAMEKALGGKGNVIMLCGPAGTSWVMGRSDGFEDYIKENCPDINILDRRYYDNDPAIGLQEMEDALQAYPEIDGVFAGSDMAGIGAANAIKSAGKGDEIVFVTSDCQAATVDMIKEGVVDMTVAQSSVTMGEWGMRAAVATLEGHADELYENYYTPLHVINKDNADTFGFVGVVRSPDGWNIGK